MAEDKEKSDDTSGHFGSGALKKGMTGMDDLDMALHSVNGLIKESREYKTYVFARNALMAKENLYKELIEFKRRYADVERYTDGNPYDELYKLYMENDELIHNSAVSEYLRAESAFSKLIRHVTDEIYRGLLWQDLKFQDQ